MKPKEAGLLASKSKDISSIQINDKDLKTRRRSGFNFSKSQDFIVPPEQINNSIKLQHGIIDKQAMRAGSAARESKYILYPESTFIGPWDILMTLCLLFTSIFRPYQVAFDRSAIYLPMWTDINIVCELMFLLDILVVFNTAYYESEFKLIKTRSQIAKNYFKESFWVDFTALIPADYIILALYPDWNLNRVVLLRLYKMVRITRLFKVYNHVTDITQQSAFRELLNIDPGVMRLSFFLLLFFILCHFTACLWAIIA